MKKTLLISMLVTIAFGCAEQRSAVPPFDLPPDVTYETDDSIEFHSFRWGTNDTTALFMMSPHPAGLNRAMVDKMAKDARAQLETAMWEVEGVADVETTTADFVAGDFSGKAIVCNLTR